MLTRIQDISFSLFQDMPWATLGKSGSEAAVQLQGRMARTFSSNILVNTMDMTAAVQYVLTAALSLGSQVCYKKSGMMILDYML